MTDVVCGMKVEPNKAPAQSQYQGQDVFLLHSVQSEARCHPQRYVQTEQYAK